jgi:hypothetical protein
MKTISFLKRATLGGFSVAESVISLGIGAVAIVGGMTLSQHELALVKSTRESNAASHALEERIEQLRLANWRQITDVDYLTNKYFPARPKSAHLLPDVKERLTVTAYPDASACVPLSLERSKDGTIRTVSAGTGLQGQRLARVNLRVTWAGKDGKERVRELASIISNAGINAKSIPPMGADSGSTTTAGSTTTTSTTPDTGGTSTTTTTTTTTPTTNNNGNGNGQGNVGGKPGKK